MSLQFLIPPAQRARGQSFGEKFQNAARVALNGGTVVGTPTIDFGAVLNGTTDRISYPGNESGSWCISNGGTIRARFKTPELTQVGYLYGSTKSSVDKWGLVIVNGALRFRYVDAARSVSSAASLVVGTWHDVVVTYDGTNRPVMYLDGVLQSGTSGVTLVDVVGSNIGANAQGTGLVEATIDTMQVYKQELTQAESVDFRDHSTYNYRNKAVLDLPMLDAQDDPGVKTLDVSGSGNHAVFGAGAAAPTKRSPGRGYDVDGSDDYFVIPNFSALDGLSQSSFVFVVRKTNRGTASNYIDAIEDGTFKFLIDDSAGDDGIRATFYSQQGPIISVSGDDPTSRVGSPVVYAIVLDAPDLYIYASGKLVASGNNASFTVIQSAPTESCYIGGISNSRFLGGSFFQVFAAPFALTPIQVADITGKMMRSINQV